MNSNEKLSVRGKLNIVLTDANGNIKDQRELDNLVVGSGITYIASRMKDATATVMSHMALGTGNTVAAPGQTALVTSLGARVALSTTTAYATNIVYTAAFLAGADTEGPVTEAGIFNALTAGTMLCRTVFPVVNKGLGDSMSITWTITLTAV